jgi:outer membrane lipase/esterase
MRILRALWSGIWVGVIRWRLGRAYRQAVGGRDAAVPIDELFVFGDSLSDTGNVHQMMGWLGAASPTPSPPYFEGRFSDGPNWVDRLATEMNLVAQPAWQGGSNFAHGGAQTGCGLSTLAPVVPNLGEQIESFARLRQRFASDAWIVLCGGHNNLIATVQGKDDIAWETALRHLLTHMERLYQLGGRQFIVPNLMPVDRTPEAPDDRRQFMREWLRSFDQQLAARLEQFQALHPEVHLVTPDFARAIDELLDHPQAYAFSNTGQAVYDSSAGRVVGDPATWFWFDECHPGHRAQQLIAQCAIRAVAERSQLAVA